jgi:hypothetical protein
MPGKEPMMDASVDGGLCVNERDMEMHSNFFFVFIFTSFVSFIHFFFSSALLDHPRNLCGACEMRGS